jgi:cation transport regulator ChaC
MLENTRLSLVENTVKALQSKDPLKIMNAEKVLRVQCHHNKIPILVFIATEIMPAYLGIDTQESKSKIMCDYCSGEYGSNAALKSHLGRSHKDKKHLWSKI